MQSKQPKTVLVLGARGRFGLAAARAFAASGWRVVAQIRPGAKAPDCAEVEWLPVTVDDTAALGAEVVVHALNPLYTQWETQVMVLLDASLRVARQLQALLMVPGNVYNFGAGMPRLLAEDTPRQAHTRKGKIRIAMVWRELREMRYLWQTPHALSGDKLAALIGPEPHTPLPVAVQFALQDLGKARRLACNMPQWA